MIRSQPISVELLLPFPVLCIFIRNTVIVFICCFVLVRDRGGGEVLSETQRDKGWLSNSVMFNQYPSLWRNSSEMVTGRVFSTHQTHFLAVWNGKRDPFRSQDTQLPIFPSCHSCPLTAALLGHGASSLRWAVGPLVHSHQRSHRLMQLQLTSANYMSSDSQWVFLSSHSNDESP